MSQAIAERFEQVKKIYFRELKQQPVATDINDIPVSYELISDEWLSKALCSKVPGARVVSHTLDVPDEGTSNRRRIFITYNEAGQQAGLPPSVFCKASQSLESRFAIGLNRLSEGESIFFNQLRPLLDIEAPVGLFANINKESLNTILIMKDIADRVEFCDHRTPMSLARVRSQVALLAKLHGTFYNQPDKRKLIEPFQRMRDWAELNELTFHWSDARIRGFKAGEEVIPERLFRRADEVDPATVRALASHDGLPQTLLHNDVHLKNWYIASGDNMGLSDWQISVKGCGVRDLVYAISTALTIEDRRKWEVDLIKYYLDCLAAEGGSPLDYNQTFLAYRQQSLAALAMWTATLTPPADAPAMQPPETSLEFIKRMAQAIDDLEALDCV